MIIVARLLTISDVGIFALAMSISLAFQSVGDLNVRIWLLSKKEPTDQDYDTAWTLLLIQSAIGMVLVFVIAEPLASFLDDPRLNNVVLVVGVTSVLSQLRNLGFVKYRRDLKYKKIFLATTGSRVIQFLTTIVLAFLWRDYWAPVTGMALGAIANSGFSYLMHPYRPRLSLVSWREALIFSRWLMLRSALWYVRDNGAAFILARVLDASAVGIFRMARVLSDLPNRHFVASVTEVALPAYVKIAETGGSITRGYLRYISLNAVLLFPFAAFMWAAGDLAVPAFLGAKWAATVPLVHLLVVSMVLFSMRMTATPVFLALGRPQLGSFLSGFEVVTLLPLTVLWAQEWGVEGAVYARSLISVIASIAAGVIADKLLDLKPIEYLQNMWRPLVAAAAAGLAVDQVLRAVTIPHGAAAIAAMLAVLAFGAVLYAGVLFGLWLLQGKPAGAERVALNILSQGIDGIRGGLRSRRKSS